MRYFQPHVRRICALVAVACSSCAARFTARISWRNTRATWGAISQLLHWLVVFLVAVQWSLAKYAATQTLTGKIGTLGLHKSIGITILALAASRLIWRLLNPTPSSPDGQKVWERGLARLSHVALYALIFALPISGWVMSSARNFAVSWFGIFQIPSLVSPDPKLFKQMEDLHQLLFTALLVAALLHVIGAFKHHYIDRDDVLRRMLPTWRSGARITTPAIKHTE
jgi:cytochrome b561